MAHRAITDAEGVAWEVWDVHPTLADRRQAADRRRVARDSGARRALPERRGRSSRPARGSSRGQDAPRMWIRERKSWLVFRCPTARHRLMPVPEAWEELSDEELLIVLKDVCDGPAGGE